MLLAQNGNEQAGGIHGLQQIMTGSGQKSGLAPVGFLGNQLCLLQFCVGSAEFESSLCYALFQRLVNQLQLVFDILEVRDVAESSDITTSRHGIAPDFKHFIPQP